LARAQLRSRLAWLRRSLLLVAVACAAAALVEAAAAKPMLGILGDASRFRALTGQQSQVGHVIVGWSQGYSWGTRFAALFPQYAPMPMLGLGTGTKWPGRREAITPRAIAMGQGDSYLMAISRAIAAWGQPIYLRPFGEMNGHWNFYCAYTRSGRLKGASHSTQIFRKAFARVYLIAHGGTADEINAKLRRLGLPEIRVDLPENLYPTLRVIWNPQGYGSPDVPGNRAQAYYPGDAYVDVVGNDLYNIRSKAEWEANDRLYRAHPSKPYSFPEWGNWGVDDPSFIRRMGKFVRQHRRVEMLAYFDSKPGSVFDLGSKPASRAAYRRYITPLGA
jgi:glycosyl hydrolase family 26